MNLIEIKIHKDWKNPQELIVQQLVFDELKEVNKEKDNTRLILFNSKTGVRAELRLNFAIIKKLIS